MQQINIKKNQNNGRYPANVDPTAANIIEHVKNIIGEMDAPQNNIYENIVHLILVLGLFVVFCACSAHANNNMDGSIQIKYSIVSTHLDDSYCIDCDNIIFKMTVNMIIIILLNTAAMTLKL